MTTARNVFWGICRKTYRARAGWGIRHGAGSARDGRPPEEERGRQEQHVLEVVDERVLERRIEERREVAGPHHPGEQQPGHDREGQHAHDPRMEDRQDPAPAHVGRG